MRALMTPTANEVRLIRATKAILKPPTKLTLTEWADSKRVLSSDTSASPGDYKTSRTPYMAEIMNCVSDPDVEECTTVAGAQLGKTTLIENICGFFIDQEPAPILVIQPTLEMAEAFSKDRLAPMLRDSKKISGKVRDAKARNSGNTILHKTYPGGQITMAGANSPASLASRPKRVVLFDECDRFEPSAGTEGDPMDLGKARTTTFHNKKLIYVSTPGNAPMPGREAVRGTSKIFPSFERGDMRYYMVKCPHCDGAPQRLVWRQVKYFNDDPSTAAYLCEHAGCDALINDAEKMKMIQTGVWVATKPFKGHASFHISALYSPFVTFAKMAQEWIEAKGNKEKLKVFINTKLAELWTEPTEAKSSWESLYARTEPYKMLTIPSGGLGLFAGVDVQHDRLAVVLRAFGLHMESWLVFHTELQGDVMKDQVWEDLDDLLQRDFPHANGGTMRPMVTYVDSGDGGTMQAVYRYAGKRRAHGVYATKGANQPGKPIQGKSSPFAYDHNGLKVPGGKRFEIGTDTAKATIYGRLQLTEGYGRYHWYTGLDPEYFHQLLGEARKVKFVNGFAVYYWDRIRPRNEVLDCEVLCLAAAHHAGFDRATLKKLTEKYKAGTVHVQQDTGQPADPAAISTVLAPVPVPIEPEPAIKNPDLDYVRRRRQQNSGARGGGGFSWRT